jgi:type I restriction enzyme M protein
MSSSIARMNLFLHGIADFTIQRGNTLSEPKFVESDRLQQFDVVLANPPYSIKQWDRTLWLTDPFGRNSFGVPPQGRADYAFFQHILASMKPRTGRCAILFPHGVLFRKDERDMRRRIIDADLIECVIGLGPGLFYNSPMEACVVFCRTHKPTSRRRRVLFINAAHEYVREKAVSYLRPENIAAVVKAYKEPESAPAIARLVDTEEILENDANLNIALYVKGHGRAGTSANTMQLRDTISALVRATSETDRCASDLWAALGEHRVES